jgi:hypothetical protein
VLDEDRNHREHPGVGALMTEYPVSEIPESWPRNWTEGDFIFPDVYPLMPVNFGKAPDQEGLWDILEFIRGVNNEH